METEIKDLGNLEQGGLDSFVNIMSQIESSNFSVTDKEQTKSLVKFTKDIALACLKHSKDKNLPSFETSLNLLRKTNQIYFNSSLFIVKILFYAGYFGKEGEKLDFDSMRSYIARNSITTSSIDNLFPVVTYIISEILSKETRQNVKDLLSEITFIKGEKMNNVPISLEEMLDNAKAKARGVALAISLFAQIFKKGDRKF
jgi:hypothetical protein